MAIKKTNSRSAKKANRQVFSTNTGHALTPLEAEFINLYLETGNARQSVINAGYKTKSPGQYAQTLLNKSYITEEISHRLEQMKSAKTASATEILEYFTAVMRGEVKDQFGLEASLQERTRAAQELAKRQIDIANKVNANTKNKQEQVIVKLIRRSDSNGG